MNINLHKSYSQQKICKPRSHSHYNGEQISLEIYNKNKMHNDEALQTQFQSPFKKQKIRVNAYLQNSQKMGINLTSNQYQQNLYENKVGIDEIIKKSIILKSGRGKQKVNISQFDHKNQTKDKTINSLKDSLQCSPIDTTVNLTNNNKNLTQILSQLTNTLNCLTTKINNISQNSITNSVTKIIDTKLSKIIRSNNNINYYDYRYQSIKLDVPQLPVFGQQRLSSLHIALGQACKQIFSTGFGLYQNNQLDTNKLKIFCSEKLLYWIIQMIKTNLLTHTQIQQIDNSLKYTILPYFSAKYPASQSHDHNVLLSSLIVERRNIDDNNNDFLCKNHIRFRYTQSGNYDSQIMRLINKILLIIKRKDNYGRLYEEEQRRGKKETLYERYESDMNKIFGKIYDKEQIQEMDSIALNKTLFEEDVISFIKKNSNNQFDMLRATNNNNGCKSMFYEQKQQKQYKQVHHMQIIKNAEQYAETVKQYSKYEIDKKIKDNIVPYTEKQILDQDFKLTDSGLKRILSKWSQELYLCFDPKTTIDREQPFVMKDGSQKFLGKKETIILYKLLEKEKKNVKKYMEMVKKNLVDTQCEAAKSQISNKLKLYTEQQSIVGQFSTLIYKNTQSYLKGYLNILIHSINKALLTYQHIIYNKNSLNLENLSIHKIQQTNIEHFINLSQNKNKLRQHTDISSQIPQLISFKVGDIFRSKCSSKQKQITSLYKQIQRLSTQKPHIFKIVRVKNKLKESTKDILINILYRQKILVEIQLAIKTQKTKLLQNSMQFKHYLYELERSKFGPIQQMCNIWVCKDQRSQFFIRNFNEQNRRRLRNVGKIVCRHPKKGEIILPFRCYRCKYYYQYPKKSNDHIECSDTKCEERKICFLCRMQERNTASMTTGQQQMLNEIIMEKQSNKTLFYYHKGRQNFSFEEFPLKGYLINLKKQAKQRTPYIKYKNNNKICLLKPISQPQPSSLSLSSSSSKLIKKYNTNNFQLLKQISTDDTTALKKLLTDNLIIEQKYQQQFITDEKLVAKIQTNYFVPKYFRSCMKDEKNSIILSNKNLETDQIFRCREGEFGYVKKINFSYNKLPSIHNILKYFSGVKILNLSNNKITTLPKQISNLPQLTQLQLSHNSTLQQIPQQLFYAQNLQYANFNNCAIKKLNIPNAQAIINKQKNISKIKKLLLNYNKLCDLPDSFGILENLVKLELGYNKIEKVNKCIGKLLNLQVLDISGNGMKCLPQEIGLLVNLQILNIACNSLETLPKTIDRLQLLKQINMQNNKMKEIPYTLLNIINLQKVNILQNYITKIPKQITNLKRIKSLLLPNNIDIQIKQSPIISNKQIISEFVGNFMQKNERITYRKKFNYGNKYKYEQQSPVMFVEQDE